MPQSNILKKPRRRHIKNDVRSTPMSLPCALARGIISLGAATIKKLALIALDILVLIDTHSKRSLLAVHFKRYCEALNAFKLKLIIMAAPLLAAGIAAGAQLLGGGISAAAQGKMNKRTIAFAREMYERQRADSLSDWTMQNEYNSPTAQMKRLREAGLNPNLVYQNGADNVAGAVRSSDAKQPDIRAADYNFLGNAAGSGLNAYYDMQIKQQTVDNLEKQNTVLAQEALLKAANIESVMSGTAKSKFDLGLAQDLRSSTLEAAAENVRQTKTRTGIMISENERAAALNESNIKEAGERIARMRQQTLTDQQQRQLMQLDKELKRLDIDWRQQGITPSDNLLFRILGRVLNGSGIEKLKDANILNWQEFNPFTGEYKGNYSDPRFKKR